MTTQLRPVVLSDAEPLHRECWPEQSLGRVQARIERVLQQGQYVRMAALVAVPDIDSAPFAYGQLTRWPRLCEISDLVVTESYRSAGVGTALIAALVEQARAWGAPLVEIGAVDTNIRALALYQRLGFTPYRTITLDLAEVAETVIYLCRLLT